MEGPVQGAQEPLSRAKALKILAAGHGYILDAPYMGKVIPARRSRVRKAFDFAVEDLEFHTREAACGRSPNNCEIICVYRGTITPD